MKDNPLMTIPEVMERLSLSRSSVARLMRQGKLQRKKLGRSARITRASVERLEQMGCRVIRPRQPAPTAIMAAS